MLNKIHNFGQTYFHPGKNLTNKSAPKAYLAAALICISYLTVIFPLGTGLIYGVSSLARRKVKKNDNHLKDKPIKKIADHKIQKTTPSSIPNALNAKAPDPSPNNEKLPKPSQTTDTKPPAILNNTSVNLATTGLSSYLKSLKKYDPSLTFDIVKSFSDDGADLTQEDANGITPILKLAELCSKVFAGKDFYTTEVKNKIAFQLGVLVRSIHPDKLSSSILFKVIPNISREHLEEVCRFYKLPQNDINEEHNGETLLMACCSATEIDLKCVKILVDVGADLTYRRNAPLLALAKMYNERNSLEILDILKTIPDAKLNIQLALKILALTETLTDINLISFFCDRGLDQEVDSNGNTLLMAYCENVTAFGDCLEEFTIIEYLCKKNAKTDDSGLHHWPDLTRRNYRGSTPLELLLETNCQDNSKLISMLLEFIPKDEVSHLTGLLTHPRLSSCLADELIESGVHIDAFGCTGKTILYTTIEKLIWAAPKNDYKDRIENLVKKGANPKLQRPLLKTTRNLQLPPTAFRSPLTPYDLVTSSIETLIKAIEKCQENFDRVTAWVDEDRGTLGEIQKTLVQRKAEYKALSKTEKKHKNGKALAKVIEELTEQEDNLADNIVEDNRQLDIHKKNLEANVSRVQTLNAILQFFNSKEQAEDPA